MKTLTKSLFAATASTAILISAAYGFATIDSVKTQTITTGDVMGMGWFQQVNDRLPPVGGVSGDVLAIGADGKPKWVCEQGTAGCGGTGSTYPGCDTADIKLANGQVWAACNVEATKAYNGETTYNGGTNGSENDVFLYSFRKIFG
jgi:hypothetical protein